MDEFNSDERFLVPDSEDEDVNSHEPWDLVSGLKAFHSGRGFNGSDQEVQESRVMSTNEKKKQGFFAIFDSSESAGESGGKKTALAYDTSSDVTSVEDHDQTVIKRNPFEKKDLMDKETSTPSEHISNLHLSQEIILVPETLDTVEDAQVSPSTAPFIVPDSPSQSQDVGEDIIHREPEDDEVTFKATATSSSANSQTSTKIDSQGLHLHFSQTQSESQEQFVNQEREEAIFRDKGIVTTPVKDPNASLSCRKLSLKDAPPSPKTGGDLLPRPSLHLPSKSRYEVEELSESVKSDRQSEGFKEKIIHIQEESKRLKKKVPKTLFMDTEEEAKMMKSKSAISGKLHEKVSEKEEDGASLAVLEGRESVGMDIDAPTLSYDYLKSQGGQYQESTLRDELIEELDPVPHTVKGNEDTQSQEFDGFEEELEEGALKDNIDKRNEQSITDQNVADKQSEKSAKSNPVEDCIEDSLTVLSPQDKNPEIPEVIAEGTKNDNVSVNCSLNETSALTETQPHDPYQYHGSQSQNIADVSNQPQSDRSKAVEKSGNKSKVIKVMRRVLKKKMPPKANQKSSSNDESGSIRSANSRRKLSVGKRKSKTQQEDGANVSSSVNKRPDEMEPIGGFTTLQPRVSVTSSEGSIPTGYTPIDVRCEMPPPMTRVDSSRKSAQTLIEASPQEQIKLNKRTATVSFQDDPLPKARSMSKEASDHIGELERKTVREFKAIVVERETTIDILDDKGNILRQTVTKEVTRTPIEPLSFAINVQVTERLLSPIVSPSRSVSTLTSGDLADISSSSLTRSISSGSKGSNPSLELCSQSYPTPAQRSHQLQSFDSKGRGNEQYAALQRTFLAHVKVRVCGHGTINHQLTTSTDVLERGGGCIMEKDDTTNVASTVTTTTTITGPTSTKPDSKRSSSGSNTGQDLFGTPNQSLIPMCDSSHLDRALSSSNCTPINTNNEIIPPSFGGQIEMQAKSTVHEAQRSDEEMEDNDGNDTVEAENDKNVDKSETIVTKEEINQRGQSFRKKQIIVKDVSSPSKGRGKRKMEEKVSQQPQYSKRARQEKGKRDTRSTSEMEGGEPSGSSLSTGFVVGDAPADLTPQDNATSAAALSKSQTNVSRSELMQEETHTSENNLVVSDIKSKLAIGEQVMGKWTDGFYYPGSVKKLDSVNQKYQLKFDDGTQRWVGPEGLLLAKELPIGQSVMVMNDDGYYICGMVMTHSWGSEDGKDDAADDTIILYHVERDDGLMQKCSRKRLLLSEDQAACLVSDHDLAISHDILPVTTVVKAGNISLDNLVEGKRQHRGKKEKPGTDDSITSGKKSAKTPTRDVTPIVSHEGGVFSSRKRKVGPVATSTPTPKVTQDAAKSRGDESLTTSVTPVKSREALALGSIASSPLVSRKLRKTRQSLFGRKLTPPPSLFKGLTFLLTHIEKSEEQRQEEKCILGDSSSLEDTSFDGNGDDNEKIHPFIKEQLQTLILAGGGQVLDKYDMEEIQKAGISNCYLVAAEHQRTVKYLQGLAGNLTIVSHEWILHSIDQGHLLGLKAFLLPAGISLEKKTLMECKRACITLSGLTMLIMSTRNDFVEAWASILSLAKCHVTTRFPSRASKTDPGIDFVVSDTTCPPAIVKKCQNLEVPLVSSEWVSQCFINNCLVDPCAHEKYRHDYGK